MIVSTQKRSVSLVLGSGGARGLAHIGVIQWLEQNGLDIRCIAGASMGALIGGIYAAGKLDAYTRWVTALERRDVVRLLDFSFGGNGLIKGERVIMVLRDLIGDRNIEDLPIAFTAVATDLDGQKEVWIKHGPLFDAIRGSIAFPTIFTPYEHQGRRLLDGGLVNPVPIAPTLNDKNDITIAVNLSAKAEAEFDVREKRKSRKKSSGSDHHRITQFIESLPWKLGQHDQENVGFFDVLAKTIDTMQNTIAQSKLAAYSPDVIIDVPRNICAFYEFHRAAEMIEIGRLRAQKVLAPLTLQA